MVEDALKTYGYEPDAAVKEIFTKYRKTHNQGVFDVYPPNVRAARSSHIITGLPDAYGRGRIIGDYRRVALYGVDALIEAKKLERIGTGHAALRRGRHPRPRGEHRADPRAAASSSRWPPATASTSPGRRPPRRKPLQWLYFAYLGAVKEQNGAAMSLGRTSTFLDVFIAAGPGRRPSSPRRGRRSWSTTS